MMTYTAQGTVLGNAVSLLDDADGVGFMRGRVAPFGGCDNRGLD